MSRLLRRAAWVSSATAPVALIGGWTVAAAAQAEPFDQVRGTISALAAHGATDAWIMTSSLAVVGVCHVVTAAGLVEAGRAGRAVLASGGVATVLVAVFAQPSDVHFPVATAAFVALAVWPALTAVPGRRRALLAAATLSALLVWLGAEIGGIGGGARLGLAERVVAGSQALWPFVAVAATRLRR